MIESQAVLGSKYVAASFVLLEAGLVVVCYLHILCAPASLLYRVEIEDLSAHITPHWKVLQSCNLWYSAPLEMSFPLVSFLPGLIFRLKAMGYRQGF